MKATRGQRNATLVFSILKILVGVVVFALSKVLFDIYYQLARENLNQPIEEPKLNHWWIYALPYVIPGCIGVIAGAQRNAVAYGFYMASCIIACIVSGIFFLVGVVFLIAMADVGGMDCYTSNGMCVCSTGMSDTTSPIGIRDCSDLSKLVHLGYGVSTMLVLGWILCLCGSIISCASCCCGERTPQVVMMTQYPASQVTVTTTGHQYAEGPQYIAGPQFPQNAEYFPPPAMNEAEEKNQYKYNRMY
ncbi:uncharacterized protein LOC135482198 [Liolophura sinensis]|uniref:uncharacterized protein LOC135482198 n=1 Tax=Liolophura sinensis TaxID=3198878 RepID=UPI00315915A5